eukprot:g10683.t1
MVADVEGAQRLLEELHRHSKDNFPDSEINDPAALVEQLSIAVLALDPRSPGQEADVALMASFMFDSHSPRDLLSFVTDTINTSAKVTKKSRMAALRAVGDLAKRLKGSPIIDRYARRIKEGVWAVFSKESESQEVRAHALRPLRELLKLKPPSLAADTWNLPAMWDAIKEQYRLGASKISQSCKGELLKLAGSLLLVYGRDVPELAEGVKTILGWCDQALADNEKNKQIGKKLQPQIVAGALACMDLVCSAGFHQRYAFVDGESASNPKANTKLYMHLMKAVAEGSNEDVTRFEVCAKALRFFRRHADLFSDNVGPLTRAQQLYNLLEKCATGGGRNQKLKLKKHALPAIEAVVKEVARYTASRPEKKATLDVLEGNFLKLLEGAKPTGEETTVPLAGLAALSPAATALSSYQEAADVADRLLVCLDSALGRLDAEGFTDGGSDEDIDGEDDAPGSSSGGGATAFQRDLSLKLEAQFLRTLACRAGVLGGVSARGGDPPSLLPGGASGDGVAEMDVDNNSNGGVPGEGKGARRIAIPGGMGEAVPGHLMRRLQTLSLRMVEKYAVLSQKDRALACRALCQLWLAFSGPGQGDNLSRVLGVVVLKGVSLAGTMETPGGGFDESGEPNPAPFRWVAPVDPVTGAVDTRLCFVYADLWRRVLSPEDGELEPLQAWGVARAEESRAGAGSSVLAAYRDVVAPEVYDAVLGAVLTAIKRLDLRYTYGTPEEGGRPIPLHLTDQNMFLNLVSFCQDLLPTCRPDLLLEWVPILCPELVRRSLERPLVSGFYRLVTLVFQETARARYFDDHPLNPASTSNEGNSAADDGGSDGGSNSDDVGQREDSMDARGVGEGQGGKLVCRRVLCRYLEWMTVRLGGFRDELLAACTETLLAAPVGLLGGDLGPLVPALKVALTSGESHLPTAVVAVGALERWREESLPLLRPYLEEILPHLDKHLSAAGVDGGSKEKARQAKRSNGKAGKSMAARKMGAGGGDSDASEEDNRRKDLRRRIVRFLGRLGGRNHLVAADGSKALSASLAWDTEPRILLSVPYKDRPQPLTICLDGVLQRLVELARHEGTRQTKTLAAECLHALVVYMVGCTATDPSSGQQGHPGDYSKLFRRVFPAVLRLAVDLDETTRTLFSKLSLQLVRWFSQAQTDNEDTLALLDCLGEGAAAAEGGPLREFCSKGIVEFLRYAIKQSSKRQQAEGPVAVDALLTRVFSLATHPDKNRRLGGLMAFNQLCRPLREETSLLDRYALRLLHVALISLRRAHHDHSALGVADSASSAVDRALRIVHDSVADMGDRADLLRHKPARGELASVQDVAGWAWEQVGAVETRFRRKCMTVLLALCPLVVETTDNLRDRPSDNDGARAWVWRRLEESGRGGVTDAVRVFEGAASRSRASAGGVGGGDEKRQAKLTRDDEKDGWDRVATSADCYNFVRETGIMTADELFLGAAPSGGGGGGGGGSQGKGRALGKKRKASSVSSDGRDGGPDGVGGGEESGTSSAAEPRVLRSLASVVERFGVFLEYFPFQSLVGEGGKGRAGDAQAGGGQRPASSSNNNDRAAAAAAAGANGPLVVDDPGLLPTERAAAQLSRAVLLRRGFTLLAGCLSDGSTSGDAQRDDMAALLVREGLWSRRAQLVVIYSLLWPWAGGLLPRAADGDEVEKFLPAAAERLLKHWKTLDKAAGPGNGIYETLRSLLRVRVSGVDAARVSTTGRSGNGGGSDDTVDLCQWILSQFLSSQEALSRPFLAVRAAASSATGAATKPSTRRPQRRHQSTPPDDELTGRVIRAYRSFAKAGLFGHIGNSGGDAFVLATGLWSSVLGLPEGLRPASEHRAKLALRLSIDLGLPTATGPAMTPHGGKAAASILAGLLDVGAAEKATEGGTGATRGALFYRRFSEPVHEALLRRGGDCPWPVACRSLVDACLSAGDQTAATGHPRRRPLLAAQAFAVLEGVLTHQSEQQRLTSVGVSSRATMLMDPGETLRAIVPEFRRLVDDPDWGPPPVTDLPGKKTAGGTGIMLRESLRLCHRLLRLAAALESCGVAIKSGSTSSSASVSPTSSSSSPSSCFEQLLEMSAVLVAGTLGSASPAVGVAAKADALTLVPFLRPCLTRKARDYGHTAPRAGSRHRTGPGGPVGSGKGPRGAAVLPALEEMVARHFPIEDSREPEEGSEQATAFALLLRGLLGAFVRCGDLALLELLFGTLAEGRKHLHYRWVSKALDAFVSGVDVEADGVAEAVFGFCLDNIAGKRVPASVKATLFDKVCLPVVRRCPVEISRSLYLSVTAGDRLRPVPAGKAVDGTVLARLLAVVNRRSKSGAFLEGALVTSCCLSLIEALYDMFDLKPLQALAGEALCEKGGDRDGGGNEKKSPTLKDVTVGVVNAWKAITASDGILDQEWRELRCRRATFSCLCAAVIRTQDQEKWFDTLLWKDPVLEKPSPKVAAAAGGGKTSVLALVMDMKKEHAFEVSPPPFPTTPLHAARPPPLGRNPDGTAVAGGRNSGRRRRHGVTSSAMLSQSSLGFHGDSLAVDGGGGGGPDPAAAEDARETYSSQAALTEPGGVVKGGDGGPGGESEHSGSKSQPQLESQSQGDMAPLFGRAADGSIDFFAGQEQAWGEEEERGEMEKGEGVVLEMSHVNKEPCMRPLLLAVQAEEKLFGESWAEKFAQSDGVFEPAWSGKMRAKLEDIDLPRNVRLMAFQFALNAPVSAALRPWAARWIKAMADFALAPLPEGLRTDGEQGLHYLLRDFAQLLLDESSGSGWGQVVREGRAQERRETENAGRRLADASRQPLLDVGNRLISHLISVSSCPEGKTAVLRANVVLVAGLVGLFGDAVVERTGDSGATIAVEGHRIGRRNDLRPNLQFVVDMLLEREGHTGGAHASTQSRGVQAKHTILTGLNVLGVLLSMRVPVLTASVPAANELARALPDVCLSYTQKNVFETGTELLAMALAHVVWLKDEGGLPPEDDLCPLLSQPEGGHWLVRRVTDRLMRMGRDGKLRSRFVHAVATIAGVYPPVLTRQLLLASLGAMPFADATCRGRFFGTLADKLPLGQVPDLEVQDLFTRLQPHLPSLLLEPEVEFIRASKEDGIASEWRPMAQLSALRLVRELTKTMTSKQLGAVLGEDDAHSLVGLATPSTYRGCREIAYATLLDLHVAAREASALQNGEEVKMEDARGGAALTEAQRETVRCALLRGLSDPDDEGMTFDDKALPQEGNNTPQQQQQQQQQQRLQRHGIRRSLLEVFDAPPSAEKGAGRGLEEDPGRRLLSLMRDMFDSRTARAWLRFAPYLLLRPSEEASGYQDFLFKKSLLSCKFVEMSVSGGAAGGFDARPMEPVFSFASLGSQLQIQEGGRTGTASFGGSFGGGVGGGASYGTLSTDVDVRQAGVVRATQDYLWSQTQAGGGGVVGAGGVGGGRSSRAAVSSGARGKYLSFPSQTQSKMLGGAGAYAGSQAAMPPPAPRNPRSRGAGAGVASQGGGVGKRFRVTSGGSVSAGTAGGGGGSFGYGMQRRMAAKRERDKARRTKRAVIYRKYRDGELPDIMIKLADVLRPLQHLSMLDGGIGREVFVQVFKEVYAGLDGSPRDPSSSHSGETAWTRGHTDEVRREASAGDGRRAVAVLLPKMLSAARHETEVVACLHAALRATATAPPNPADNDGGGGGGGGRKTASASSSSLKQHGKPRAGRLFDAAGAGPALSAGAGSRSRAGGRQGSGKGGGDTTARGATADAALSAGGGDAILLPPELVANTALSSLNIHSGIMMLEDSIMRTGKESAAAAASQPGGGGGKRRRGGKGEQRQHHQPPSALDVAAEKGQHDSWLQLSKLYAALGERDALVGVAARASKSEETRQALQAELSGEYDVALKIYKKLMTRYDTRYEKNLDSQDSARCMDEEEDEEEKGASEAELRAWDMHQLECMRQLGQWKELRNDVVAMVSEDEDDDVDGEVYGSDARSSAEYQRRLWGAEPARRDDVLPFFVWSIVHDQRRSEVGLKAFLDAIVDPDAPLIRLAESSGEWAATDASPTPSPPSGAGARPSGGGRSLASSSSSTCTRLGWLEANMPAELAKAFLLGKQLGRAHQCIARCYDRFQEKWAGLHPCADSARRDQLRGLQLVVEVEDFLSFHGQNGAPQPPSSSSSTSGASGGLTSRVTGLLTKWSRQAPSKTLDPVTAWSAVIAHRQDCFKAIEGDLKETELADRQVSVCRRQMLKHTGDLSLEAAGAAIAQGVQKVAGDLIVSYTNIKKAAGRLSGPSTQGWTPREGEGEEEWDLQLALTTAEFNRAQLQRWRLGGSKIRRNIDKRVDAVARTLKALNGCIMQQEADMGTQAGRSRGWGESEGWESQGAGAHETRLRLLTLQGQWLEIKGRVLAEVGSSGGAKEGEVAESLLGALASLEQATELGDRLVASEYAPLRQAPTHAGTTPRSVSSAGIGSGTRTSGVAEATGEAMLRLAKLCEVLSSGDAELEPGAAGEGRGREELAALAVKEYLRAMAVGSPGARDRFPRVLFLAGRFSEARKAFASGALSVPEWTFLRWVDQMLGVVGREEGPVVTQVLERVALAYPRALFFPLLMTKASAARRAGGGDGVTGAASDGERLSKLTALTADPSGEAFAEALGGLHHPELRFQEAMKRVFKLVALDKKDQARATYRKMWNDCMVTTGRKTGDDKVGSYNREFAKQWMKPLEKLIGRDGERLEPTKIRHIQGKVSECLRKQPKKTRMKLSDFSTWLSDFDSHIHKLEVPGQYSGLSAGPPRVSQHTRIISFDSELLLMHSLRLPKRLIMHGDDERDHMFLVKGGEDLRVDQRVEQLFEVMNAVMATSASCRRAGLSSKTYKVIPVTPDIGMIEWVQNTCPLKSVIEKGLGCGLHELQAPQIFTNFVNGNYHEMFMKKGRIEVENMFHACCASVPTDALRRQLLAMAPFPEAFLTCRGGFARSLATLNACSYVLGIGDRHLDNFLLDTTTGTVVGIDFGAAFGFAHKELPVPEMIPFRLTNQFQNLLQPLDSVGLLKGHMVSILQALRGGSEVLLATMDVFLNEPVLDWISEGADRRQNNSKRGDGDDDDSSADDAAGSGGRSQPAPPPEAWRKIKNARRKLQGENPVAIVVDDIAQNMHVKKARSLEKIKGIVGGGSGSRVRSRPENSDGWLSVENQVECLIDLATDPDVLGRQYIGLATWV